ncbi:hypothetical protein D3C80_2148310 [compost metagenome]
MKLPAGVTLITSEDALLASIVLPRAALEASDASDEGADAAAEGEGAAETAEADNKSE